MSPLASSTTPEPSDCWTRWRGKPKGDWLPKKRRNAGSSKNGERVWTTRREYTLTTAGAAFLTIGAKDHCRTSRFPGGVRVCASAENSRVESESVSPRVKMRVNMRVNVGMGRETRQPRRRSGDCRRFGPRGIDQRADR